MMANKALFGFTASTEPARATLTIDASRKATNAVSPYLFGKFCEHLGNNIYQGMEAQILFNPTLARWIFNGALTMSTVACTPSTIRRVWL